MTHRWDPFLVTYGRANWQTIFCFDFDVQNQCKIGKVTLNSYPYMDSPYSWTMSTRDPRCCSTSDELPVGTHLLNGVSGASRCARVWRATAKSTHASVEPQGGHERQARDDLMFTECFVMAIIFNASRQPQRNLFESVKSRIRSATRGRHKGSIAYGSLHRLQEDS